MIKYDKKWFKMSKLWHFKVLATEPLFWIRVPADAPDKKQARLGLFFERRNKKEKIRVIV